MMCTKYVKCLLTFEFHKNWEMFLLERNLPLKTGRASEVINQYTKMIKETEINSDFKYLWKFGKLFYRNASYTIWLIKKWKFLSHFDNLLSYIFSFTPCFIKYWTDLHESLVPFTIWWTWPQKIQGDQLGIL